MRWKCHLKSITKILYFKEDKFMSEAVKEVEVKDINDQINTSDEDEVTSVAEVQPEKITVLSKFKALGSGTVKGVKNIFKKSEDKLELTDLEKEVCKSAKDRAKGFVGGAVFAAGSLYFVGKSLCKDEASGDDVFENEYVKEFDDDNVVGTQDGEDSEITE